MADPALALQGYQVQTLRGATSVGTRVYDTVPDAAAFPYISLGEAQVLGEDNDCNDASEVVTQVHVWSRKKGFPEAKQIAGEVRAALAGTPVLEGFAVPVAEFVRTEYMNDPDGLTRHAVVEFRYQVDHLT
jgi:hypothetical protein